MLQLARHTIIGLDMDGTLVPDHNTVDHGPLERLRAFVRASADKQFHIITFRDPAWAARIPDELFHYDLCPTDFIEIHSCPPEFWVAHQKRKYNIRMTKREAVLAQYYREWKGHTCLRIGATVLVDDTPRNVLPGCEKYGIEFIQITDL